MQKINGSENRRSGYLAEFLARMYYRLHGWRILQKNFRVGRGSKAGEVDFIALKGKYLVFVEVKKRTTLDLAAYAITQKQQKRIANAASYFLKRNPQYMNMYIRFDAMLVKLPLSFRRIENAWDGGFTFFNC